MREFFINDFGRLRSGWRLLIFAAAFIALIILLTNILRVIYFLTGPHGPSGAADIIAEFIFRGALLGAALGAGVLEAV
mgnify:CR=1 FL=1